MAIATDTRPASRPSGPRLSRRATAIWRGIAGVAGLAVILELISRSGLVNPAFLPPFSSVVAEAFALWGEPAFREDVFATLLTYVYGMLIASVIAIPLGILFGLFRPAYRAARATVELMRPIPPVALIPLVLLILGAGLEMKLVIVVFAAVWPIMFNTLYGVNDVDPYAKEMARSFGVGRFGVVRRIIIPSSAPFIVTGIRIASSIALIVVITVELIAGGAQGIGAFISRERAYGDADSYLAVLAATITAGILGLLISLAIGWAERRYFGWDSTTRESN
ncbi:ABC transporter permease [Agromyces aerolatus]|uniref:ABC transporter permease n=1 Tax=Agromyces sp. LY-1074 TaxID=3074080 RepID=UPI0028615D0D|nr:MULTISPECIES: ABC transporter permease [unclassified Agromyces]MDR5698709.1 ABC transporter permease [Agromyces sp. LY-1074]MDR5705003.1 ABC transporter permease [Agromyces sp. LY-1358]